MNQSSQNERCKHEDWSYSQFLLAATQQLQSLIQNIRVIINDRNLPLASTPLDWNRADLPHL